MKGRRGIVARVCILATFFTGCYSSTLIDPAGDEKAKIYSEAIEYVVTKTGTAYEFDDPPAIANDTIVGEARVGVHETSDRQRVSIPLDDVANVRVKECKAFATLAGTTLVVVGTCAGILLIGSLIIAIGPHGD